MKTTPNMSKPLNATQETEAISRVSKRAVDGEVGWFVQLDLHGNDFDGPHESEDEAIGAARELMADGEITGTIC